MGNHERTIEQQKKQYNKSILKGVLFSCPKEGETVKKHEKEVQQAFLDNEEVVIRNLKNQYHHALKEIEKKAQALQDDINRLGTLANLATDADEKARFLSMQQSYHIHSAFFSTL